MWNQFLACFPGKLFDVLKWTRLLKQVICLDLSVILRKAVGGVIKPVFCGTEPTSPMTTVWLQNMDTMRAGVNIQRSNLVLVLAGENDQG